MCVQNDWTLDISAATPGIALSDHDMCVSYTGGADGKDSDHAYVFGSKSWSRGVHCWRTTFETNPAAGGGEISWYVRSSVRPLVRSLVRPLCDHSVVLTVYAVGCWMSAVCCLLSAVCCLLSAAVWCLVVRF